MRVTLYDSWLSRVSCLAENALYSTEIKEMKVTDDYHYSIRNKDGSDTDYICVYKGDDDKYCRYLPATKVHDFSFKDVKIKKEAILKALPIREGASLPATTLCDNIDNSLIASGGDVVGEIALCLDKVN